MKSFVASALRLDSVRRQAGLLLLALIIPAAVSASDAWQVFRAPLGVVTNWGPNLLLNAGMETNGSGDSVLNWAPFSSGYTRTNDAHSGTQAIHIVAASLDLRYGATQTINLNQTSAKVIRFSGWSKASNVNYVPPSIFGPYSMWVYAVYTNGTGVIKQLDFSTGTHDWEYMHGVLAPDQPVASLTCYLLFGAHRTGEVWFDDIIVAETEEPIETFKTFDGVLAIDGCPAVPPFDKTTTYSLSTGDGLELQLSKTGGVVCALNDNGHNLYAATSDYASGWFVCDRRATSDWWNIGGVVTPSGAGLAQHGAVTALDLTADVLYTVSNDAICVSAVFSNLNAGDRALSLYFALPADMNGGTWWADPRNTSAITDPKEEYEELWNLGFGARALSAYPLATVCGGGGALSLTVPPEKYRPYRLVYNNATRQFYAVFDVGISPLTEQFPQTVSVEVWLYRSDPEWGLRSGLEGLARVLPTPAARNYFQNTNEGMWCAFGRGSSFESITNIADFGIGINEGGDSLYDDSQGLATFRYVTEASTYWMTMPTNIPNTNYDSVIGYLMNRYSNGIAAAEATLSSGIRLQDGRLRFNSTAGLSWCPYGACFYQNASPYIDDTNYPLTKFNMDWSEAARDVYNHPENGVLDGEYMDSFFLNASAADYSTNHIRTTSFPLTYTSTNFTLMTPIIFSSCEAAREIAAYIHPLGKAITANGGFDAYVPICRGLFDYTGTELDGYWLDDEGGIVQPDDLELICYRAMSGQRPFAFLFNNYNSEWASLATTEETMRICAVYGIYPSWQYNSTNNVHWADMESIERDRPLYKKYIPIIKAMNADGWQPVTCATAGNATLMLERFGTNSYASSMYLTMRNLSSSSETSTVSLDLSAWVSPGGASILTLTNLFGTNYTCLGIGTNTFTVTLSGNECRVYRVRTPAEQTISFPAIPDQLTTDTAALAATASSGLPVSFAVVAGPGVITGQTNLTFTTAGTVSVMAIQPGDPDWTAAAPVTNTFIVSKASASVTLGNLDWIYDESPKAATAATVPAGLSVALTYDGSATAPAEVGNYAVVAAISDAIYQGSAGGTLVIGYGAAPATNSLPWSDNFEHYYNGTPLINGVTGWYASAAGCLVQTNVRYADSKAGMIPQDVVLSNRFAGVASTGIWARLYSRAVFINTPAHPYVLTNYSALFYINSNGYFVAHKGPAGPAPASSTNWVTLYTNAAGAAATPVAAGAWTRIDVFLDYPRTNWSLYVNGDKLMTNFGFIKPGITSFGGFDIGSGGRACYSGGGTSYLDDAYVTKSGTLLIDGLLACDKNYDGTTGAAVNTNNLVLVGVDAGATNVTLNISNPTGNFDDADAGLGKIVRVTGITLAGSDAGFYELITNTTANIFRGVQAITNFPAIGDQVTTNSVVLSAQANSGLPVTNFMVIAGPGVIAGLTNLTFTNAGSVSVTASRSWEGNWYPTAPATNTFTVSKAGASVTLDNLSHVYDGSPKAATATTAPAGLSVVITYNGSAAAPTEAGSYTVTGMVDSAMYQGSDIEILTISKIDQTISFANPGDQFATNTVILAATASSGLPVGFAVTEGPGVITGLTNLTFTNEGSVSILATQSGDQNWNAAAPATNTFAVSKASATVTLGSLNQVYDAGPKAATAATAPAGLSVAFTYDGSATAPTEVGSYAVTGVVDSALYEGSDSGTLTVSWPDPTTNSIPWSDDFESYNNGRPLINGVTGWYASAASCIVQTNVKYAGSKAAMIPQGGVLSNRFAGIASTGIWTRFYARAVLYDGQTNPYVATNMSALFYINSNGYAVAHNGPASPTPASSTNWVALYTNAAGAAAAPVAAGDWTCIEVFLDYPHTNWSLYVNGDQLMTNFGFINAGIASFGGFDIYNGTSTSYLDSAEADDAEQEYYGEMMMENDALAALGKSADGGEVDAAAGSYAVNLKKDRGDMGGDNAGLTASAVLAAPASLMASDGAFTDKVAITWGLVSGASGYQVWRAGVNNAAAAVNLDNAVAASYDDRAPSTWRGTMWYYWVKAWNSVTTSEFSRVDTGFCRLSDDADLISGQPVVGDYDGDGRADPAVYDLYDGRLFVWLSSAEYALATPATTFQVSAGDVPLCGDFDGDGLADPGVFNRIAGSWHLWLSSENYSRIWTVLLGLGADDIPVPEDYDGDRKTDPAVYQPSTGAWHAWLSSAGYIKTGPELFRQSFADYPMPGQFDGDYMADPAVYQPAGGEWYVWLSGAGYNPGAPVTFGTTEDHIAVPADYDGDGLCDPAAYVPLSGRWRLWLSGSEYALTELKLN